MSKLKHSISLAFIAVLAGACGSKAPVINSFTSSPATSLAGDPVTLSWDVSGATTLTIDKGVGDVSSKKSIVVTPQSTLTFTLTATSDGGSVTKSLTQTVKPKTPPTRVLSFTASPVQ
ncbi:MAG: hypothetical protein JST92_11335, partial [Deltaproteobacteria bacterium]|nr:hypothetical protein [Deltaproteobacteria bacterium]